MGITLYETIVPLLLHIRLASVPDVGQGQIVEKEPDQRDNAEHAVTLALRRTVRMG